jgi:anti-anti-sigma regulatory factor
MTPHAPFRHFVKVEHVEPGMPFLNVHVEGPLDAPHALTVAADVSSQLTRLVGRPFGLLIDVRKVTSCDAAAAGVMQNIEMSAAGLGLEAVAHLVKQKGLANQAQADIKDVGAEKIIGTFDNEAMARQFASGVREESA